MARRTLLALGLTLVVDGCEAPTVTTDDVADGTVDASDASADEGSDGTTEADVRIDTRPRSDATFPDGRPCTGHDEDLDGIPDECDDCPALADPAQRPFELPIGVACQPLPGPFAAASKRLFFDPFTTYEKWIAYADGPGVFVLDDTKDAIAGGTETDTSLRFIVSQRTAGAAAMVATLSWRLVGGFPDGTLETAGLLLRASGDPKQFYVCYSGTRIESGVPVSVFGLARAPATGCDGAPCTLETIGEAPRPAELPTDALSVKGLRASVTSGASGSIECRIFSANDPATLHVADPRYVVTADLPSDAWIPAGEVGLVARRAHAQFLALDVLVSP